MGKRLFDGRAGGGGGGLTAIEREVAGDHAMSAFDPLRTLGVSKLGAHMTALMSEATTGA